MVFVSFIVFLFIIAGAYEYYQSYTRKVAGPKHFASNKREGASSILSKLHIS